MNVPRVSPSGWVERRFTPVRDAFGENFTLLGEVGAAVAVYVRGRLVVHLWGGMADVSTERPWTEETVQIVFSVTKGVVATCAHLLLQRGEVDLDEQVSAYWPEFDAEGKKEVTLRWLLSHRAGLPVTDSPLTFDELLVWENPVRALAATAPKWRPGERHGYHPVTWGFLVGEVIRRVSGRSPGRYLADEVAGPLQLDFWIGVPDAVRPRIARLVEPLTLSPQPSTDQDGEIMSALLSDPLAIRALTMDGALLGDVFNNPAFLGAEVPSTNGVGSALSLAKLYALLITEVDGTRLLNESSLARATAVASVGPDEVLKVDTAFGLGFARPSPFSPLGAGQSFGHPGFGGSVAFADPERGYSFAYVTNQMTIGLGIDARAERLIEATRRSLAGL